MKFSIEPSNEPMAQHSSRRGIKYLLGASLVLIASCGTAGDATESVEMSIVEVDGYINGNGQNLLCLYSLTKEGVLDQSVQSEVLTCDFGGDSLDRTDASYYGSVALDVIQFEDRKNSSGFTLQCLQSYNEEGVLDQSVRSEALSCDFDGLMVRSDK